MTSPQGRSSPRRYRPRCGSHAPDRDSLTGSPAQQLVEDLSRIVLRDDHSFNKALDAQAAEQERLHRAALERALAEHEAVRRAANITRQKVELDLAQERLKHEQREQHEVEEKKRQLAEQQAASQRTQLDLVRRAEEALKHAADIRAAKDAAEQRIEAEKKAQADAQRRDADAKAAAVAQEKLRANAAAAAAAAEEEAKQKAAQTSVPATAPAVDARLSQPSSATAPQAKLVPSTTQQLPSNPSELYNVAAASGVVSTMEQREIVHQRYLDLHQRLKAMREDVRKQCAQHTQLKTALGDWRRAIIKCIGQQNKVDKTSNKRSTNEINSILAKASSTPGPQIDVSQYIIDYREKVASKGGDPPSTQGPGILLFLLNHFAKCVIRQFITESAVDGLTADPLGILTAVIFSKPEYQFHGLPLIDMFWAKYHRCCPPLFGIYGPQATSAGRARLGWMREAGYAATTGHYLREDAFFQRLTGLGAGFSAVALRDFSRAKAANPAPNRLWWEALARILNTPPAHVQPAHFVVLKGMLEHAIPRAIALFGGAGKAVVRQALVVFPQTKADDPQAKALAAIASVMLAKHHSTL